jgi:hypothetical protein
VRNALPFHRALQDTLEQNERLSNRNLAGTRGNQAGAKLLDAFGRELAKPKASELRKDVFVPQHRVEPKRRPRQVGLRVEPPPLFNELRKRLLSRVDDVDVTRPLPALHFGVEGLGVPLATQYTRSLMSAAVAPAHAPDDAAPAFHPFNAQRRLLPSTAASAGGYRGLPGLSGHRGEVVSDLAQP